MTVPGDLVRLTVVCEPADYADGLAARRLIRPQSRTRLLSVLTGPLALLILAINGHGWWVIALSIGFAISLALWAVGVFFPRAPYYLLARALVKHNRSAIDGTVTVTEHGLELVNDVGQHTLPWSRYQRYVETTRSFVLLTSTTPAAGVFVLPKRAATEPGDVDQLRTILSRHLPRFVA